MRSYPYAIVAYVDEIAQLMAQMINCGNEITKHLKRKRNEKYKWGVKVIPTDIPATSEFWKNLWGWVVSFT